MASSDVGLMLVVHIQYQENCEYFNRRLFGRVSHDTCFDVFRPFWISFKQFDEKWELSLV
jgi:hypothetical protein